MMSGYFSVVYRETDNRSILNVYSLNERLADYSIRQGNGRCVCCVVLTNDTASPACCTALIKLS